jgi:hypothetical protein
MPARNRIAIVLGACAALAACDAKIRYEPMPAPAGPAPASAAADSGTVYGTPDDAAAPVALADLLARPGDFDGKKVRVEGTVTDVCAKRGCWIKVGSDAQTGTVTFKVQDGVMVFPMSAKGRHVVADGTARKVVQSLESTRAALAHEAEEAGRPFDPATVTEPRTLVRLDGIGARVR